MAKSRNNFRDTIFIISAIATILVALHSFWPNNEITVCVCFYDGKGYPVKDVYMEGPDGTRYPNVDGKTLIDSKLVGQTFTIHDKKTNKLLKRKNLTRTGTESKIIMIIDK